MTHTSAASGSTKFAHKLRGYRKAAGLTQAELADLTGVKREYISSMELGRIAVIYPEAFNALRRVLRFPAFEMLEAMGFQTDSSEAGVNAGLLMLLKQLNEEQQRGVLAIVKAASAINRGEHPAAG